MQDNRVGLTAQTFGTNRTLFFWCKFHFKAAACQEQASRMGGLGKVGVQFGARGVRFSLG